MRVGKERLGEIREGVRVEKECEQGRSASMEREIREGVRAGKECEYGKRD